MTKLYELQRGDHFKIVDEEAQVPVDAPPPDNDGIYKHLNIDGMYSRNLAPSGEVHYLAAWTEVEKVTI